MPSKVPSRYDEQASATYFWSPSGNDDPANWLDAMYSADTWTSQLHKPIQGQGVVGLLLLILVLIAVVGFRVWTALRRWKTPIAPSVTGAAVAWQNKQSNPIGLAFSAFNTVVDSTGRRGIHIFGLPREQMGLWMIASVLFAIPCAVTVGVMPFWDRIGDFFWIKEMNSYVAPATEHLSYQYRADAVPRFPVKRFLIGAISLVELILLTNFASLFVRGVRKHALLVWLCYDRSKLLQYVAVSGLMFCILWYVFFFDWRVLSFLMPSGFRLIQYGVMAMPIITFVFGHMAMIVCAGISRDVVQKLKRL